MSFNRDRFLDFCESIGCGYKTDVPLKDQTTFRIGGNASVICEPDSAKQIACIIKNIYENDIKHFVIGRGSNILASDSGFDGVIIKLTKSISDIKLIGDTKIYCGAGASLSDICMFALEHELTGLEFAYGIPGTAGGGLFMNAGAYGGELKDAVISAHYIDRNGKLCEINVSEMELSYRSSIFSKGGMLITDMIFSLEKGEKQKIKEKMDELIGKRRDKQPLEYPSAGSTFKRPEGSYASLLIEQCGLKGLTVGGAQVSEKHSGFVINKGGATFEDVIELTDKVRDIVKKETGFTLELEPVILK